eukprot:scaffold13410_cov56-Cyclotella_meneghiniana.AAC.2
MASQALVKRSDSYWGELKEGKEHGFGTMFYSNGAFYIGNWKEGEYHGTGFGKYADGSWIYGEFFEGKQHGKGHLRNVNGDSYDGDFCEGVCHGKGLYTNANGDSYDGEWCDGEKHGRGLLKLSNGASYDGEWCKGECHGRGVYSDDDGNSYDGEWCNDKKHGRGVYKFADGGTYVGEWLDDKYHGRGVQQHANCDLYDGEWCEDKHHGRGIQQRANGDLYDGEWFEGKIHGKGLAKFADGESYDGEWCKNKRHGRGLHKYADGSSYNGEWCEGKRHGRGLAKFADGDSYDGEWCKNKRHGRGLHKFADGSSYDGEWCEGKCHGRGLHRNAEGDMIYGKWIDGKHEYGNDLRIVLQDNSGLMRILTVPPDDKISAIFSAYETMTGKSPCRIKHKERYIFYSQSKKQSLNHFGICNNYVIAVEVPVLTDISNNYMTNHTATSSIDKRRVAKTKRHASRQRRPWAGSVIHSDSDRVKHSKQMNLVLKEIQPQLEHIRQRLHDLTLERTQPKGKAKSSRQAPANLEQVEYRPDSVGIGSKTGKGLFVVNVGEANNLYKTSKQSKLLCSNPTICLGLHKLTKEQALAALNENLPTWIEIANSGVHPFVIQVRIVCGKGSQVLSEVVMQWINSQQQVAHAPKRKQ